MKLRNIFIAGLSLVALASCQENFLDVDAPSKNTMSYVFSDKLEMARALNGVYTGVLSGNTFGDNIFTAYQLNSDVDFRANGSASTSTSNFKRFDCDADGSQSKIWNTLYEAIENANLFIEGIESSPLYNAADPDVDVVQMLGEAKVLRAIFYHELIWMFGDVPFSFNSSKTAESLVYPVTDRVEILDKLIADLRSVAPKMKASADATVERPNKEMAYAMIARLALTAGGYTLRPDGDTYGKMQRPANYKAYYTIARNACDTVINVFGTHRLVKPFHKVFVDECNFIVATGDDPMFEIPFGKASTGNIGYIHGPQMKSYESLTNHNYGEASSGAALNAFYRYMFDEDDIRRDYINQLFYYDANATANPTKCAYGYTVYNGKWSKLWNAGGLGNNTQGNTGINYPYMRYTDVLLMFAEADNEVNEGPTAAAIAALEQVRTRAFASTNPSKIARTELYGSKADFLKAVLDERKFEFAGENMRWRDLVRNNQYNLVTYYNFLRYYAVAEDQIQTSSYTKYVSLFDCGNEDMYDRLPLTVYHINDLDNYDETTGLPYYPTTAFPNSDMKVTRLLNPYKYMSPSEKNALGLKNVTETSIYPEWASEDGVKGEVQNSLLGYIYQHPQTGNIMIVKNGQPVMMPEPDTNPTVESLPVLRYIIPYPNSVIRRSHGAYVNKYGYK